LFYCITNNNLLALCARVRIFSPYLGSTEYCRVLKYSFLNFAMSSLCHAPFDSLKKRNFSLINFIFCYISHKLFHSLSLMFIVQNQKQFINHKFIDKYFFFQVPTLSLYLLMSFLFGNEALQKAVVNYKYSFFKSAAKKCEQFLQ
jgi:hypothetical protein